MVSPARWVSYKLLCQITLYGAYSDEALNSDIVEQLGIKDRHLTTEIVYGTLRWQALLDYILACASDPPWEKVHPKAKILLRMSLYQMRHLDRIPDHALVNDAVELAKRNLQRGIDSYINGTLRYLSRSRLWREKKNLQKPPLWIQVSLPKWLWKRWVGRYGQKTAKDFALSLNTSPQIAFHLSGLQRSPQDLPFSAIPSELVPGAYIKKSGRTDETKAVPVPIQYQDEASQLIPHLLHPCLGWKIWDVCAAPGGKSVILSQKCGPFGKVIASDLRWERSRLLLKTLKSASCSNSHVLISDARQMPPFRSFFDAVLVDVPCSGLGTLRRNPEIKWHFQPTALTLLRETQRRILNSVAEAVRIGGSLLYSTCSTEPEENEQVVREFLCTHPEFHLEKPAYPPGINLYIGDDRMVRTFPGIHLWDAFFGALMMRRY